jgi:hypothetical protein
MPVHLIAGAIWASDDPMVQERPDFFLPEPPPEQWIRTTPDSERLEGVRLMSEAYAEAEADRALQPTRTLLPY